MRIISGKYKGRRFNPPKNITARPTTDFAKENLFNVLNNYMDFEETELALDLFAGTGSISIELLSRGCRRVISVERDPQHFSFLLKTMKELGTTSWFPVKADAFRFLERSGEQFDFIFADPPYALEGLATIPDKVFGHRLLKADGLFVLEHGKDLHFEDHPHFLEHRHYGSVNFSFFRAAEPTDEPPTR